LLAVEVVVLLVILAPEDLEALQSLRFLLPDLPFQ
jgi:hypothetical protein